MKWNYLSKKTPQDLKEFKEIILLNRKIEDPQEFFEPKNPLEISLEEVDLDLDQIKLAVKRIQDAIKKQQKVVIFGDYDADGICATAILWETLNNLGLVAQPFIPHREKHGYGISDKAIDDLLEKDRPDLIITVDNGIVAHGPLERLAKEKIDVIVTDHHQPEEDLPEAYAIVHTTKLCGATVAWMLARELNPSFVDNLLDLAAVATISDLVPLLGANRSFAKYGLEKISENNRVGISSILLVAGLDKRDMDSGLIGFGIGPRINAMGRLAHGLDALRLLVTKNSQQAMSLATLLNDTNLERQSMTYDLLKKAKDEASLWKDEHLIIVHSTQFHEGVIGLIAGKLTEEFAKPAIVISIGEETAKASARSVVGVNIIDLIRLVKDDLLEAGGHPMAAGFGLLPNKIEVVKQRLLKLAVEQIDKKLLDHTLDVDCAVPYSLINEKLVDEIQVFAPFGQKNPRPFLAIKKVTINKVMTMGKEGRHLKLLVGDSENDNPRNQLTCLLWNKGEEAEKYMVGDSVNIAGTLQINEWNGWRNVQMVVRDVKQTYIL